MAENSSEAVKCGLVSNLGIGRQVWLQGDGLPNHLLSLLTAYVHTAACSIAQFGCVIHPTINRPVCKVDGGRAFTGLRHPRGGASC